MIRLALLAACMVAVTAHAASGLVCDATNLKGVVSINNICTGWKLWKKGDALIVVCPGDKPPAGAVELRPFYVVKKP